MAAVFSRRAWRHGADVAATVRFELSGGINAIGTVAPDIGLHVLGRKQRDRMASAGKAPGPW